MVLALSWPFGFPARFADSGATSLRSDNAPPIFLSRLRGSVMQEAIEIKKDHNFLEFHWCEEKLFGTIVHSACEISTDEVLVV